MIKGIHHISLTCETKHDFDRAVNFYVDILGLTVSRKWQEGVLLDTGNGFIEIFNTNKGERIKGAIRHVAFLTDDVDTSLE